MGMSSTYTVHVVRKFITNGSKLEFGSKPPFFQRSRADGQARGFNGSTSQSDARSEWSPPLPGGSRHALAQDWADNANDNSQVGL